MENVEYLTIRANNVTNDTSSTISIKDTSGKNTLTLKIDNLYYITSAYNYVEVFYKKEENLLDKSGQIEDIQRVVLRNTLKTIEEDNQQHIELFRCHKAYIVNCKKVIAIEGNAKLHNMILCDIDTKIPVSRFKNVEMEEKLSHLF